MNIFYLKRQSITSTVNSGNCQTFVRESGAHVARRVDSCEVRWLFLTPTLRTGRARYETQVYCRRPHRRLSFGLGDNHGTEIAGKLSRVRILRFHVHSTVMRPFCKIDKTGSRLGKWYVLGNMTPKLSPGYAYSLMAVAQYCASTGQ